MPNSDIEWEKWGKTNPYFGVSSHVQFLNKNLSEQNREDFFRAGENVVDEVYANIRLHFGVTSLPDVSMDFGCGVGRLTIPLASRCKNVIGIDVSESMLREAESNVRRRGISNAVFVKSDDLLSRVNRSLGLIISFYVFQHIPIKRGLMLMEQLASRLDAGGVGVIHFPAVDTAGRLTKLVNKAQVHIPFVHQLVNVVKSRPWNWPQMEANVYPLNTVVYILERAGCKKLYIDIIRYSHRFSSVVVYFKKVDDGQ